LEDDSGANLFEKLHRVTPRRLGFSFGADSELLNHPNDITVFPVVQRNR
jgi:hypothetical protein